MQCLVSADYSPKYSPHIKPSAKTEYNTQRPGRPAVNPVIPPPSQYTLDYRGFPLSPNRAVLFFLQEIRNGPSFCQNNLFLITHNLCLFSVLGSPGALGKKEISESLSDPPELRM
jgi:hypothetical protein